MADRRGFSLIEIIAVLIIFAIAVAFILPNLTNSVEVTKAQAAKSNLLAIAAAQSRFNEDYSANCTAAGISPCYCVSTGANPNTLIGGVCGGTMAELNSNLRLSIPASDQFTYICASAGGLYSCTATDGTDTLTLTVSAATLGVSVTCAPVGGSCPS